MVNLLPLSNGETISSVLPLPENEAEWSQLHVMFATAHGTVRRNSMDAFTNVPTAGKIAMRFDEDATDRLIGVVLLTEADDVLLAKKRGRAIRFAATDVREFQTRTAAGVRGTLLADPTDEVISVSVLPHFESTPEERDDYLRHAVWKERNPRFPPPPRVMTDERFAEFQAAERFVLTVTRNGFGKRSSSHEIPTITRGGQGVWMVGRDPNAKREPGDLAACFPGRDGEQLMLVTDQAKLIRLSMGDAKIAGRATQGLTLFRVADDEHVVSAARIEESEDEAEAVVDVEDPQLSASDSAIGGDGEA
jgi:DNA gyrase subunit A